VSARRGSRDHLWSCTDRRDTPHPVKVFITAAWAAITDGAGSTMSRYPDIAETEGNGHGVTGEFSNFVSDIEHLITSMTSLTGQDLERAKQKLAERVEAAKLTITETGGRIADTARESARATDTYVRENPWQSVGIGAILGLLVGIAVSRKL
jgi:ElaB/YqjD/DUF883 family membrane-anchored ribosome-binding protein